MTSLRIERRGAETRGEVVYAARTDRSDVGRHGRPPRPVGTRSAFKLSHIVCNAIPRSRMRTMRFASSAGMDPGRPSLIPCAFFTAGASLVLPDDPSLPLRGGGHHRGDP